MVTYGSRHAMLWVRFPAPHPIRLVRRLFAACLAVLALSVSVNAETYTAAGQKFVGNGSTFSSIGGYATSSMTFAGTGGIMLYNAFSNLDRQISDVRASSVTSTSLCPCGICWSRCRLDSAYDPSVMAIISAAVIVLSDGYCRIDYFGVAAA